MTKTTLFHSLSYEDPDRAIEFLEAVGFTSTAVYRDDSGQVLHAEYAWGDEGAIMFGSVRGDDDPLRTQPGQAQCYCVVQTDAEVDRIHAAALAAGGASLREPADDDGRGRGCTVRDPEGNWSRFGLYPGE